MTMTRSVGALLEVMVALLPLLEADCNSSLWRFLGGISSWLVKLQRRGGLGIVKGTSMRFYKEGTHKLGCKHQGNGRPMQEQRAKMCGKLVSPDKQKNQINETKSIESNHFQTISAMDALRPEFRMASTNLHTLTK
jgi:hypothetical protein